VACDIKARAMYPEAGSPKDGMIHTALKFLTGELNSYLRLRLGVPADEEDKAYLTSVASDGVLLIPERSLGVSLINIEEERMFKEQRTMVLNEDDIYEKANPEIRLNLYMLISANFQSGEDQEPEAYEEGLKQLSYAITFFQSRNVFTPAGYPSMLTEDPDLKKLVVELFSYNFEQLYNFWSVVGTSYLPSALYKVKVVRIREKQLQDTGAPIEHIRIDSGGKDT
jgi:hypothetical protein